MAERGRPVLPRGPMSAAFDAGFSLAAVLAGDPSAEGALGALTPTLKVRVEERLAVLGKAMAVDKARALRHLALEAQGQSIEGAHEPRRILAMLATEVPKERGMVWLAAVPKHRAGWSAPADLKDLLMRRAGPSDAEREAKERAELSDVARDTWAATPGGHDAR
jgi:hypothetical protein